MFHPYSFPYSSNYQVVGSRERLDTINLVNNIPTQSPLITLISKLRKFGAVWLNRIKGILKSTVNAGTLDTQFLKRAETTERLYYRDQTCFETQFWSP